MCDVSPRTENSALLTSIESMSISSKPSTSISSAVLIATVEKSKTQCENMAVDLASSGWVSYKMECFKSWMYQKCQSRSNLHCHAAESPDSRNQVGISSHKPISTHPSSFHLRYSALIWLHAQKWTLLKIRFNFINTTTDTALNNAGPLPDWHLIQHSCHFSGSEDQTDQ